MFWCVAQTSTEVFEEVLLKALKSDLTSALNTPEQLELLLVALQKFPSVLKPQKLKKLLGTTTVITKESLPKSVFLFYYIIVRLYLISHGLLHERNFVECTLYFLFVI